jgi:hypothetical protein
MLARCRMASRTGFYAPNRHDTGSTTARSVHEVALIRDTVSPLCACVNRTKFVAPASAAGPNFLHDGPANAQAGALTWPLGLCVDCRVKKVSGELIIRSRSHRAAAKERRNKAIVTTIRTLASAICDLVTSCGQSFMFYGRDAMQSSRQDRM